jgi:hypothetical protein
MPNRIARVVAASYSTIGACNLSAKMREQTFLRG